MSHIAFIFPGQGSQSVGMLAELAAEYPVVGETFAEASEALGYNLWNLVQDGPESELGRTDRTQPAMLTGDIAVWRAWRAAGGPAPAIMAGHSLGEYSALVAAEAMSLADAVPLVADRGLYMQEAVPAGEGAMAAILGLDDAEVIKVCAEAEQGEVVQAVNFNSPGQVVIAGASAAVKRATELAGQAGAKRALLLPVSVPSHCSLMQPAAERLARRLADVAIAAPSIAVINNADVEAPREADAIRAALVKQLYLPVRWVEIIRKMAADGVSQVFECGPGKVLAGLNKRIERGMQVHCINEPSTLAKALEACAGDEATKQ